MRTKGGTEGTRESVVEGARGPRAPRTAGVVSAGWPPLRAPEASASPPCADDSTSMNLKMLVKFVGNACRDEPDNTEQAGGIDRKPAPFARSATERQRSRNPSIHAVGARYAPPTGTLAMQKVVGSSPIIRSREGLPGWPQRSGQAALRSLFPLIIRPSLRRPTQRIVGRSCEELVQAQHVPSNENRDVPAGACSRRSGHARLPPRDHNPLPRAPRPHQDPLADAAHFAAQRQKHHIRHDGEGEQRDRPPPEHGSTGPQ